MTPAPIRYLIKAITLLPILICREVSKLMPRDPNRIAIGAWFGNFYSDNPKYFCNYLLEHTSLNITWIGKKDIRSQLPDNPNLHFARKGSWAAILSLLRAKTWICCIGHNADLSSWPIDGGATCINLWHGIAGKKSDHNTVWDRNSKLGRGLRGELERLYARIISGESEWLSVSYPELGEMLILGNPTMFCKTKILPFGMPRNDFLINNLRNAKLIETLKEKYAKLLGFDPRKKIVGYLPTWRGASGEIFCFYNMEKKYQEKFQALFSANDAILIEKHHVHTYELFPLTTKTDFSLSINATTLPLVDTQELLLITDILITDYSSVFVDFGLLKRPIIHFAYDLDNFEKESAGAAYNFNEIAGGPIVKDIENLMSTLSAQLIHPSFAPAIGHLKLTANETGNACQQILSFIEK